MSVNDFGTYAMSSREFLAFLIRAFNSFQQIFLHISLKLSSTVLRLVLQRTPRNGNKGGRIFSSLILQMMVFVRF